jgi:hypothetical protein
MSEHKNIEAERRRKGGTPVGRAEAPQREMGGNGGGGLPRPSGGRKQLGGCGTIVVLLIVLAVYFFSNGQINLLDSADNSATDAPQSPSGLEAASVPESNYVPPVPDDKAGQTWTIMLYQDADDQILEKDIFVDFNEAERVGSSDRVNIVSQIDRFAGAFQGDGNWTGARRYYLTQDNDLDYINSQIVQDLGEVDMSNGSTLVDFVQWAAQNYPADHYVLILSDHGMGWPGGWSDPAPGGRESSRVPLVSRLGKNLYLMNLEESLRKIHDAAGIERFEIIGMDACLMGQLEVMTALQPHTRYAVASEETEPALGWAYASFLGDLVTNPDMSGAELSQKIVNSYIDDDQRITDPAARADFMQGGSPLGGIFGFNPPSAEEVARQVRQDITISAIDLDALPALNSSMNDFAFQLQNEDPRVIAEARNFAQSYTSIFGREVPPSYIDLGHFVSLVSQNTGNTNLQGAASTVLSDLGKVVIANKKGAGKKGSTGLAIYFPNSTLYSSPLAGPQSYIEIASRFAYESLWDDFLAFHYMDRSFEAQPRLPSAPAPGYSVRAPGRGNITVSEIQKSSDYVSLGNPVHLSVNVIGDNIGYIYLFVGYLDPSSNSIAVLDTDFLESPDTNTLDGIYYPVWGNDFTLWYNWEPTVFAMNDGQIRETALFTPQSYGETSKQAAYTVQGIYTFSASGESVNAYLLFENENLVQVFGMTGVDEAAAPREITPQPGDTFTLMQKWLDTTSAGTAQVNYQQGKTFTFGEQPFKWETLYAAAGDYVVGFIIEDLDGNQYPVYTQITVR